MKLLEGQDQQVAGHMSCSAHSDIVCCSDIDELQLAGRVFSLTCLDVM